MFRFRAKSTAALVALATVTGMSLVAIPQAGAATCTTTWTGGATGVWSNANNWSGGAVAGSPGHTTDNVCIPAGSTVTLDVNATIQSINADGSAAGNLTDNPAAGAVTLTVNGTPASTLGTLTLSTATVTFGANAPATIAGVTVNGGTFSTDANVDIGSGGLQVEPTTGAPANVSGSGTITVAGPVNVLGGNFNSTAGVGINLVQTGTHVFNLGTATVLGNPRDPQFDVSSVNTPNDIHVNGSVYTMASSAITTTGSIVLAPNADLTAGGVFTAAGITTSGAGGRVDSRFTVNGSSSSLGGNLIAGLLTIDNGGSVFVPAGIHVGQLYAPLVVNAGGTLSGDGIIDGTLRNYGNVAPSGDSANTTIGTLTVSIFLQQSTGTLHIKLASAASNDQIAQTLTSNPALAGTISITRLNGYVPAPANQVTILTSPNGSSAIGIDPNTVTVDDLTNAHYGPPTVVGTTAVVTLQAGKPGAPGLSLTAGPKRILANVTAPASDGGAAITAYYVSCNPDCGGTHKITAPGVVTLTGLTDHVAYAVSAIAENSAGQSPATTMSATPVTPTPPVAKVTSSTPRLIVASVGKFSARCSYNLGKIKSCVVTAKSPTGVIVATGKAVTTAGATTITVPLTVTPAGLAVASGAGGVTATLTATVTPVSGSPLKATTTMVIVKQTTKVSLLSGVLFGSDSAVLRPSGQKALTGIARQIAGSRKVECDGHTAVTGNPVGEHKLGLQRAVVVCTFIKHEITVLHLHKIGTYVTKSYGGTRPVSKTNQALNRRVELIVTQ